MASPAKPRKEPLFERRARVEKRLEQQRIELAAAWNALERQAYVQERRISGITRGFRAVLPLGALGGAVWLLRRYGPARLVRPAMFGLAVWKYFRRFLDLRLAYRRGTS
jgi:hypothetical protein